MRFIPNASEPFHEPSPAAKWRREMAPVNRLDAMRASLTYVPHQEHAADEAFELDDFEAELKRLSAANQELMDQFQHSAEPARDDVPAVDADANDGELAE